MNLLSKNYDSVETILKIGRERAPYSDDANRIAHRLGIMRYLYLADMVRQYCRYDGRILDLGGGYGQVAFFLKKWGYNVEVFEVRDHYEEILKKLDLYYHIRKDGDLSLYSEGAFDSLIEVAVLQLIDDKRSFIRNIHRLLKPGGLYFCCQFPNENYWLSKWASKRSRFRYYGRDFGILRLMALFEDEGFHLKYAEQFQFIPMNFFKINYFVKLFWDLDRLFCNLPLVRNFSNMVNMVFEC